MVTITQSMGYEIDKEELIKALNYDREQYNKGFSDCKSYMLDKVKQAREDIEDLATEQIQVYDEENPYISCAVEYVSLTEVRELLDKLIEGVGE